jgi:hypothetical protein
MQTAVIFYVVSQLKLDLEMKTIKIKKADAFYKRIFLENSFSNDVTYWPYKLSWNPRRFSYSLRR